MVSRHARNEICTTAELQPGEKIAKLYRQTIADRGSLVPFCQICGSINYLWKFGANHLYCGPCFIDRFKEKPFDIVPKKRIHMKEVLPLFRQVPYSEYTSYISVHHPTEVNRLMFDKINYEKGRAYLCSLKLKSLSNTLTRKQKERLYVLACFYSTVISCEVSQSNCLLFKDYRYLLDTAI